jgi:hypothetical protein
VDVDGVAVDAVVQPSDKKSFIYKVPDCHQPSFPSLPGNPLEPRADTHSTQALQHQTVNAVTEMVSVTGEPQSMAEVSNSLGIDGRGMAEIKIERVSNVSKRPSSPKSSTAESKKQRRNSRNSQSDDAQLIRQPLSVDSFPPVFDEMDSNNSRGKQTDSASERNSSDKSKYPASLQSPLTPHFSPTMKNSSNNWMNDKDLVANSDDLDNLFEPSDEESLDKSADA